MDCLVDALLGSGDDDGVGALVGLGDGDLGGRLGLQVLQAGAALAKDVLVVVLRDLQRLARLGLERGNMAS